VRALAVLGAFALLILLWSAIVSAFFLALDLLARLGR